MTGGGSGAISKDIHAISAQSETSEESSLQPQTMQIRLGRSYQDMLYEGVQ